MIPCSRFQLTQINHPSKHVNNEEELNGKMQKLPSDNLELMKEIDERKKF